MPTMRNLVSNTVKQRYHLSLLLNN